MFLSLKLLGLWISNLISMEEREIENHRITQGGKYPWDYQVQNPLTLTQPSLPLRMNVQYLKAANSWSFRKFTTLLNKIKHVFAYLQTATSMTFWTSF